MAVRRLVKGWKEIARSDQNDLRDIAQVMPIGSTVDLTIADHHYMMYQVTYGQVVPRLKVLPEIHRALKQKFGGRLLDMIPSQHGFKVKLARIGLVK